VSEGAGECVLARSSALPDLTFPSLAALVRWVAASEPGSFHVIPGAMGRAHLPDGVCLTIRRGDRGLIGRVFLELPPGPLAVPCMAGRLRAMLAEASARANAVRPYEELQHA
jgi:hypothetical protein